MTTHRRVIGQLGERRAAEFLTESGLHVLDRNWRYGRRGEIDIVAVDPLEDCYVLVEVRTRTGDSCGSAMASVDIKKYKRLRMLAAAWLSEQTVKRHIRIDIISIEIDPCIYMLLDLGLDPMGIEPPVNDLDWVKAVAA